MAKVKTKTKEVAKVKNPSSLTKMSKAVAQTPILKFTTHALETKDQTINEFSDHALHVYGSYVVEDRAVPDFRDGLKPVHRAVLWALQGLNLHHTKGFKKAARAVGDAIGKYHPHGDCLGGETKFYCLDGKLRSIKSIYESGVKTLDVLSWDEDLQCLVPAKAHSFRIGQHAKTVYHIKLSDGSTIRATSNHPFYVNGTGWVSAEDLSAGQSLMGGSINMDAAYREVKLSGRAFEKMYHVTSEHEPSEGYIRHHKNHNRHDDRPSNIDIISRAEHAEHHKDYLVGLRNGNATQKSTPAWREATRKKNSALMRAFNDALPILKALKALALLEDRGLDLSEFNYNELAKTGEIYNLTKLSTLEQNRGLVFADLLRLHIEGFALDTSAAVGHTEHLHKESEKLQYDVTGMNQQQLLRRFMVCMMAVAKRGRALTWANYRNARLAYIDQRGQGADGLNGRSVPKRKTLEEAFGTSSVHKLVKLATRKGHGLFILNIDVIRQKAEPMYDFTVDGYENAIIVTKGKTDRHKTFVVAHNSACYGAMVTIANSNPPLVWGQGGWGKPDGTSASAYRYTEAKKSKFADMFLLDSQYLKVVPMGMNFSNDEELPLYLPALLPTLFFLTSTPPPAYGVKVGNPAFSVGTVSKVVVDMLNGKSYTAKKLSDTLKIVHPYGCIDVSSDAAIEELMASGKGSVQYMPLMEYDVDNRVIRIRSFCPGTLSGEEGLDKALQKLANIDGVKNASNTSGKKNKHAGPYGASLEVACPKNMDEETFDEVCAKVDKLVKSSVSYRLGITIRRLGDETNKFKYVNYVEYFVAWVKYRIKLEERLIAFLLAKAAHELHLNEVYLYAVKNREKLLKALPKVLASKTPATVLAKALTMPVEDAEIILERKVKQLAALEADDLEKKIKGIKAEIKVLKTDAKEPGKRAAIDTAERVKTYLKKPDPTVSGLKVE